MNELRIDPFVYQKDIMEYLERHQYGSKYVVNRDLIIDLKVKPTSGCVGQCYEIDYKGIVIVNNRFTLAEDGTILIQEGFIFNGPNVVDDTPPRMLGSLVHDALCSKEAEGQYNYYRKNWFYSAILKAQKEPSILANAQFLGLLLGNWVM